MTRRFSVTYKIPTMEKTPMINYAKDASDKSIRAIDDLLKYSYQLIDSEYQFNRTIYMEKLAKLIRHMDRSKIANHEFWIPHNTLDNETLCLRWTLINLSKEAIRNVDYMDRIFFKHVSSCKDYSHLYNKAIIDNYELTLFTEFAEEFNNMMRNHRDIMVLYMKANDIGNKLIKHHSIKTYTWVHNL